MDCFVTSIRTEEEAQRAKHFFAGHQVPTAINTARFPFPFKLCTDQEHHLLAMVIKGQFGALEQLDTGKMIRTAAWNQCLH